MNLVAKNEIHKINNIKKYIFDILKEFNSKKLNLMITGGSFLDVLDNPNYKNLNTDSWNIFFSDERCIEEFSNYNHSKKFISYLNANVFRIQIDLGKKKCIDNYEAILVKFGKMDVCFLGIGDNGHICSLWPNSSDLNSENYVIDVNVQCPISKDRITITLKYINSEIDRLYFVIPPKNGEKKKIEEPHLSIKNKITKNYITILYDDC